MTEWNPKIGDKVYCVCEYYTSDYTMRYKGLEGFRNYGLEVVESIVKSPYKWKSGGLGCVSVCLHREVGDNANNLFYWKKSDLGTRLFPTREEAAAVADVRAHNMDLGMWGKKYENRPMYKNWLHWNDEEKKAQKKQETQKITQKQVQKPKRNRVYKRKNELPEELYTRWRDGKITAVDAAKEIGVSCTTFEKYALEILKARGEIHTYASNKKGLPEGFNEAYEEWKAGKINEAEAGKKCKMNHARFRREAIKRLEESGETKQRKDGYGTHFPDNFREVCDLVLAGEITAAVGAKRCSTPYTTFYSWIQREKAER